MEMGAFLRKQRLKAGFTIQDIVDMAGNQIDKTTVSRIERDERKLSLKAGYYFSQIYEIPLEELARKELGASASRIKKIKPTKRARGRKKKA
ncbi:MAG TPA: helix-turn-helix transcriptional regulator [bacterium]|nr:MAG: Helix-turn-helix domain protein [bacterium ADurb.Bin236]HOC92565.1 helix-turn-helix transcriptional regulator [bacterium]HOY64767.1 helix-turn-helix transcriptional regulator [bacterium]